jgi:hypothetical protein
MRDARSGIGRSITILVVWLIPVALMLISYFYPTEGGYLRDILVLPVILVLLYTAFLVAPLFRPLRNLDFFDDVPDAIERRVGAQRVRKDARDLIRLYDGGRLPNVYEMTTLTPFQSDVKRIAEGLRADADWHASNAEVSRDLLERMETLMHAKEEEDEPEGESSRPQRRKGGKHR